VIKIGSVSPSIPPDFPFVSSPELDRRRGTEKAQRVALQKTLPSPLYWVQFPGGRKIFWNWELVRDYLIRGNTTDPAHQQLVEQYLSTLPQSS
jgi:hypothetical protein